MEGFFTYRHRLVVFGVALLGVVSTGIAQGQGDFTDDFERPDVFPPDGWTVFTGDWGIVGGELTTTATAAPGDWIWAGDPPIQVAGNMELVASMAFGPSPGDDVGRHGGFMFYASQATQRGDPATNGYTLDWIDRTAPPYNDYGFRLIRIDAGQQTPLFVGTPDILDVPESWVIEVENETIRLLAGPEGAEEVVFEVIDDTYRDGHLGCWVHENATQMFVDELDVSWTPIVLDACFTASTLGGVAPLTVDFDASCTVSLEGVNAYQWDFGDGDVASGETTSHEFLFGGSYMVTLTVQDTQGNIDTTSLTVETFDSAAAFEDEFDRPNGPVDGWTVFRGTWDILNEELVTTNSEQENWVWAGDPAFAFPANFTLRFTFDFRAIPADTVGRHGGVMFCATKPTHRYDSTPGDGIDGYTIDWIDRTAPPNDHGIRLNRWDDGVQADLDIGAADLPDPPVEWEIVVEGEEIRVFGDGVQYLEATDSTYRNGFFGCWVYSNGQSLAIDNVEVTSPGVNPCFAVTTGQALPVGEEFAFDASCSSSSGTPIVAYDWDFGDGATAAGPVVTHAYTSEGIRDVTLTLQTEGGLTGSTSRAVDAFIPVEGFEDDFERDDGPPDGWTIVAGDWSIAEGALHVETPVAPESWIFAGSPAARFGGFSSIEVDVSFLEDPPLDPAAAGRHGGIFFFAQTTNPRFQGNSGYLFDWIDRASDHGYRLSRFDAGVQTLLVPGTQDAEPGTSWRIEIEGDTIRALVDGEIKAEVVDTTYRWGYFALWGYPGNQDDVPPFLNAIDFDNVVIGEGGGPTDPIFHRGDANADGGINITDGIYVLNFLFLGGEPLSCTEAANANDDDAVNITDGIYILNFLFLGGAAPLPPGPPGESCGPDPVDSVNDLGCDSYQGC